MEETLPAAETSYPCLLAWARLLHVFFAGMIMLYQIVGMWCYTAVASHACRRCDRLRHPRARGRSDDLHGVRPRRGPALHVVHLLVRERLLARLLRVLFKRVSACTVGRLGSFLHVEWCVSSGCKFD